MDELGGEAVNSVERRRGSLADRPQKARFPRPRVTEGRLEDLVNFPSGEGARHTYQYKIADERMRDGTINGVEGEERT